MVTICTSFMVGLNISYAMEPSKIPFIVGVTLLAVILLIMEVVKMLFPKRKHWGILNCLFLAILLGLCIGEIVDVTILKLVLLDNIVIAIIAAGASIYQIIMESKNEHKHKQDISKERIPQKQEDVEQVLKKETKKQVSTGAEPKTMQIQEVSQDKQIQGEIPKKDADDIEMPSPEVVANIMRNLNEGFYREPL